MTQKFKTIYFSDHPAKEPEKKNIKIAFGNNDLFLHNNIHKLTSEEIRTLLGYDSYVHLKNDSRLFPKHSLNSYCLSLLRKKASIFKSTKNINVDSFLDPLQATFKGGDKEPLHNWYPFLEGFSPRFVEEILTNYSPNASVVFDPFAGSGTTPLTIAKKGKVALYCEVNPVMQYLIRVKISAYTLSVNRRNETIANLRLILNNLDTAIPNITPNHSLHNTYKIAFGTSEYFSPKEYELVLKTRSYIDLINCNDPISSCFLTIATLSSLVPASLLMRAGDLRFKTPKEIVNRKQPYLETLKSNLSNLIADLSTIQISIPPPIHLCEDVKNIYKLPPQNIEAVITSPPYLNGTNYFRNTKVELWFLNCLTNKSDLTGYRKRAITAGINDVIDVAYKHPIHPSVRKIVTSLRENAYDSRIPKMVEAYFDDMTTAFSSLRKHLVKNTSVAIDIGDSIYSGIHVKTDCLLRETLGDLGYSYNKKVLLRKRLSRDKTPLQQTLLLFNYSPTKSISKKQNEPSNEYSNSWNNFKKHLPHQQYPYSKRNWGHPLHSLCSYQGKMKPALAHHLVKTFLPNNSSILDPFSGVGTIPFEAALLGHRTYAFDISPAAKYISTAKLRRSNLEECEKVIAGLDKYIRTAKVTPEEFGSAGSINVNGSLKSYFEENTFSEILLARRYFLSHLPQTPSACLVFSCLLHILHGNRPYALSRRSHPITPFSPSGTYIYKSLIEKLNEKVLRSFQVEIPENFKEGVVYFQDATGWWPQEISELDAVITSPPFFDSTRFYSANWMRLWFCGWEKIDFSTKPKSFVDERQKTTFDVYTPIFRQARERLKDTGIMVLHLGKSTKCDMGLHLSKLASKWFKVEDIYSEKVTQCESHGIKDNGSVTEHQYLVLTKA